LYWRNISPLSNTVFKLAHYYLIIDFINLLKIFLSSRFNLKECLLAFRYSKQLYCLKHIFFHLDDDVDNAPVEEILSQGEATLGPAISPFLQGLISAEALQQLDKLISSGLISKKELYAFFNLLASKLKEQTRLILCYQDNNVELDKAILREQIAQRNLESTGVFIALMTHLFKKDQRIIHLVHQEKNNALTYEYLQEVYQEASTAGELIQMAHDVLEFRHDLNLEDQIGKITPNYFLAQLEKNKLLVQAKEELNRAPKRVLSARELPESIRAVFLEIERTIHLKSFSLGTLAGIGSFLFRFYEVQSGFLLEKPIKTSRLLTQPIAAA
jgi:hypothetical protein